MNAQEVDREWQAAKQSHEETMLAEVTLSCGTEVTLRKDGRLEIGAEEIDGHELLQFLLKAMDP